MASSLSADADRRVRDARWLAVPQAAVAGAVVGLVLALLTIWWAGIVAAVVVAGAVWWRSETWAANAPARQLGGVLLHADDHPRLANLVDALAIATGEPVPEVRVLDEPGANLAVVGPPGGATMVVTTGLLSALDRVELEGALAEGFARIRANDALVGGRAAALVGGPLLGAGPSDHLGWRGWGAARRARRIRSLIGDRRDFLADLAAVDITRYPPALRSALETMDGVGTAVRSATWATTHLWIAPPITESTSAMSELFSHHEPTTHRVDLLAEL